MKSKIAVDTERFIVLEPRECRVVPELTELRKYNLKQPKAGGYSRWQGQKPQRIAGR